MSKERELLVHALDRLKHINYEDDHLTNDLIQTIQKLLAQPEQENLTPRQGLAEFKKGYAQAELDLKREPLDMSKVLFNMSGLDYLVGFKDGVLYAEIHHKIGVDNEC
jgi:hypothetical protein